MKYEPENKMLRSPAKYIAGPDGRDGERKQYRDGDMVPIYLVPDDKPLLNITRPLRIVEVDEIDLIDAFHKPTIELECKNAAILQDDLIAAGIKGEHLTQFETNVRGLMARIESLEKELDTLRPKVKLLTELNNDLKVTNETQDQIIRNFRTVIDNRPISENVMLADCVSLIMESMNLINATCSVNEVSGSHGLRELLPKAEDWYNKAADAVRKYEKGVKT